jgi:hypothetical protein
MDRRARAFRKAMGADRKDAAKKGSGARGD